MARPGTIALSHRADNWGVTSGDAEFEATLTRLDELIEHKSQDVLATVSEQRMRRILHALGWAVLTAPGHRFNTPGPDAIAWRLEPGHQLSVMILDNKATTTRRRTVSTASGLRAPSLVRHRMHRAVRYLLERTLDAARAAAAQARQRRQDPATARIQLPSRVRLVVTNACGANLTGVSAEMSGRLGIGFLDLEAAARGLSRLVPPLPPCPPHGPASASRSPVTRTAEPAWR
jgi:hypothetical protein